MGTPREVSDKNFRIILFDGVCNLCSGAVQFIIQRDPGDTFRFASLQSEAGQSMLKRHGLDSAHFYSIVVIENGQAYQKSDAALKIARHLSGAWPMLGVFRILPRFLRDAAYNLIARNRYRLFGKKDECMIPTPALRARFID